MNRSLTDGLEHLSGWSEHADLQHLLVARGVKAAACPPLPTFTWHVLQSPGQQKHWIVGPAPDACPCRPPEAKESPVDRKISIGPDTARRRKVEEGMAYGTPVRAPGRRRGRRKFWRDEAKGAPGSRGRGYKKMATGRPFRASALLSLRLSLCSGAPS